MENRKPVFFLLGPTASGKTNLALQLSACLPFEIISVDSGQVYLGMDIGTAKPDMGTLRRIRHHLVDVTTIDQPYSAGLFREQALSAMRDIETRGNIPLLVGGTMLYFRALERGLGQLPLAAPALREAINEQAERSGWPALHARLKKIDPQAAAKISPNDARRIERALEVYQLTGQPISHLQRRSGFRLADEYQVHRIMLMATDRRKLHQDIESRFRSMLSRGLVEEVRELAEKRPWILERGAEIPSPLLAVGYRQIIQHLRGEYGYQEMVSRAIIATRQLAKRQVTWMRGDPGGYWFAAEEFSHPENRVPDHLLRLVENLRNP